MKTNFEKVKEFNTFFQQPITLNFNEDILNLRYRLITEEYRETMLELYDDFEHRILKTPKKKSEINKQKLAKELADLLYVVYGTGVAFGINLDDMFNKVHESNMSKVDDDGKPVFREDGKVMKTHNYKPVELG